MTYKIIKVEKGLIDDDFVFGRTTLKAYVDSNSYISCKLYPDGRIVGWYITHNSWAAGSKMLREDKYEEYDLDAEEVAQIKSLL